MTKTLDTDKKFDAEARAMTYFSDLMKILVGSEVLEWLKKKDEQKFKKKELIKFAIEKLRPAIVRRIVKGQIKGMEMLEDPRGVLKVVTKECKKQDEI